MVVAVSEAVVYLWSRHWLEAFFSETDVVPLVW